MTKKPNPSAFQVMKRKLAATKKKLAATVARLRKVNGKAKPKPKPLSNAKPSPRRARVGKKTKLRHDLGRAELGWYPWERLDPGRFARYGVGLSGENEGKSVIVLFAERDDKKNWKWEVYPKDDYVNALPAKFADGMGGPAASEQAAKLAAEQAVGLS